MRRLSAALVAVAALATVEPRAVTAQTPAARPMIRVDSDTRDFGKTGFGPALEHVFTITNAGNAVLEIKEVKPACGCTVAGNYPPRIEPGASAKFPFTLATIALHGRYEKSISIFSNDPVTPELRLKLRGEVIRPIEVVPMVAYFGTIIPDAPPPTRMVTITNRTGSPLQLSLVPVPPESKVQFELMEKSPGQIFELRAIARPPFVPGDLQGVAVLKTNVESQRTVEVRATGRVPDRLDVEPQAISIYAPPGTAPAVQRPPMQIVRFTNYGKTPVRLVAATTDDPALTTTVVEYVPGKSYGVHVQWPSGYETPAEGRTIVLKTDDAERPFLRVPVRSYRPLTNRPTTTRAASAPATPRVRPAELTVGKPAPTFSFKTIEGKSVSNADLIGPAATVLNFTAPNCPHCRKQIPQIEQFRAEYEPKGIRFVDISGVMGKAFSAEQVVEVMKSLGSHMELALDPDSKIGLLFKATSFPTLLIVSPKGRIEQALIGDRPEVVGKLRGQLETLLKQKPTP